MVENENRIPNTENKSLAGKDIFLLVVIGIGALICLSIIINYLKEGDTNFILFHYMYGGFNFIFKGVFWVFSFIWDLFNDDDSSISEGGSRKTKRKSKRKLYKNKKTNKNAMKNKK